MGQTAEAAQLKEIVDRLQKGDVRAQSELIDLVQPRLYKFCRLLSRNREVAEDLCQETLIRVLQNIHSLKNAQTFIGWMFQISKNLFLDLKRKPGDKGNVSEDVLETVGIDNSLDLILNVQTVLSQFDPEDRFLLLMVELEGCSYKEAADALSISEDAVRSKLHRLREIFMKKYNSSETK